MMTIRIEADTKASEEALRKLDIALRPSAIDAVIGVAAQKSLADIVRHTPKKWTGQLRREWRIVKPTEGERQVVNNSKVMTFLEYGTANAGTGYIYPRVKKFLYLPLNRKAAMQGWHKGLVRQRIIKLKGGGIAFQPGDYVLRRRVRGIKPRRIVADGQVRATLILQSEVRTYLRVVGAQIWGN